MIVTVGSDQTVRIWGLGSETPPTRDARQAVYSVWPEENDLHLASLELV